MAERISAAERMLSLTVALLSTDQGLTRAQIFGSVSGYVERVATGADEPALERMFERDKETLAALGTRLEVIGDPENPQNLRDARYRIPQDDNALPDDLEFDSAELAVLSLAADAWTEATMSREARAAVRKIGALGVETDEAITGFAPRLSARDESFAPLQEAIDRRHEVRFDYLRPGSQRVRTRRVQPLALVQFQGRWHLHGLDVGVGEPRTFLLSRIVSPVSTTGTQVDPSLLAGAAERALAGLREVAARQHATIEAVPDSEAALRLGRRASSATDRVFEVPYVDAYLLADELASYGPDARVVDPPELRALVVDRLERVARVHAGDPDLAPAEGATLVKAKRRTPVASADRVRTVLTLVPWLLERDDVPVLRVAEAFDVTPAEVRAMLTNLTLVGEPAGDYYSGQMFDIDWDLLEDHDMVRLTQTVGIDRVQRFTSRESAALIAGLQLVAALPGAADADTIARLRDKLGQGSATATPDTVVVDEPVDDRRSEISRAVRERRVVAFDYRTPDGETMARRVDPARLLLAGGQWYLQGWCHLREGDRTFLLDRMSGLEVTDDTATHSSEQTGSRPGELFERGDGDVDALLRFPTRMRTLLADYLVHAELRESGSDTFASIPFASPAGARRLAAYGGGDVEVLSPPAAREAARTWAQSGAIHNAPA
ncbi:WYL domain-containing protein [Microbacterium sorbitolivorans]|uniref:WYL domain-containing protein n=1 Tax=Microbacterium sorbitolivorans TaxID=1867410 RepID=A0A367Y729_9MICO|nr:WYL domain-containing protein [Microbacterium sorbitolivorans]RCK61420.1 WYL domain-containing protein [Microbacterium sorbitolivorans]GGF32309.1 WYL domain-containing protein [Microbacterium sorbitolivorans]